jgi:hypothetical protein
MYRKRKLKPIKSIKCCLKQRKIIVRRVSFYYHLVSELFVVRQKTENSFKSDLQKSLLMKLGFWSIFDFF